MLKDDIYFKKQSFISKKMKVNSCIALENGLSEEQIDFIENVCTMRHLMHTNIYALYNVQNAMYDKLSIWLYNLRDDIIKFNLPKIKFSVDLNFVDNSSTWDEIDSLDFACESEEEIEAKEKARQKYEAQAILDYYEIHDDVENWLRKVDKKYKTEYAPSGMSRFI